MENRDDKHYGLIKKLVANARAIITEEVGLSIGVRKMCGILYWLKPYKPIRGAQIHIFKKYDDRIGLVPIGSARLYCSKEAFERYDADLQDVNNTLRKKVYAACFEIIENYGDKAKRNL